MGNIAKQKNITLKIQKPKKSRTIKQQLANANLIFNKNKQLKNTKTKSTMKIQKHKTKRSFVKILKFQSS